MNSSFWPCFLEVFHAAKLAYPEQTLRGKVHRVKFWFRSLFTAGDTFAWFDTLRHRTFHPLTENHPRLYLKLQWPYLTKDLPTHQKRLHLQAHYQFLRETFSTENIKALCTPSGLPITQFALTETDNLSIVLRSGVYEKEGELTLSLVDKSINKRIYSITFSVTQWNSQFRELFIGGLQGHRFEGDKLRVIELTRSMFGLRPKALLLFVIQQLACLWDIQNIHGVSNRMHINRSYRIRREIHTDYDLFWNESGATLQENGLFLIPLSMEAKDINKIKPNKRSMYRKRYAMLSSLAEDIASTLHFGQTQNRFFTSALPLTTAQSRLQCVPLQAGNR